MRKSMLFIFAAVALAAAPDMAMAKHKIVQRHVCPTITHYFSWFSTYSEECLDDILDEQYLRHMRGEGNHNPPQSRPRPT